MTSQHDVTVTSCHHWYFLYILWYTPNDLQLNNLWIESLSRMVCSGSDITCIWDHVTWWRHSGVTWQFLTSQKYFTTTLKQFLVQQAFIRPSISFGFPWARCNRKCIFCVYGISIYLSYKNRNERYLTSNISEIFWATDSIFFLHKFDH